MGGFDGRCGHGVHLGVQWDDSVLQIVPIDRVMPLEHFHGLMSCGCHYPKMVHPSPSYVHDKGMSKIMNYCPSDPRPLTICFKGTSDGPDGFAAISEYLTHPPIILSKINCRLL